MNRNLWLVTSILLLCCELGSAQLFKQRYELWVHDHQKIIHQPLIISCLSLNTYGVHIAPDKAERMKKIAHFILENDADIVLLQELFMRKHVLFIWELIKEQYPFSVVPAPAPIFNRTSGLVIFSKFPVGEIEALTFKRRQGIDVLMPKGCLLVLFNSFQKPFWLLNTHLQAGGNYSHIRYEQVRQIAHMVDNKERVILGGDFNIDFFRDKRMFSFLENSICSMPCALTEYSSDKYANPLCTSEPERLDYFLGKEVPILSQHVIQSVFLSDHFPIVMRMKIP